MIDPADQTRLDPETLGPALGIGTTLPSAPLHIYMPPVQSVLYVTNDAIRIESSRPVPNIWIRFWHRVLLGWRWESL